MDKPKLKEEEVKDLAYWIALYVGIVNESCFKHFGSTDPTEPYEL